MTSPSRTAHAPSAPIGIMWGFEGSITAADDAFLHIIGYTREDLEQGRIDWLRMTPPEYLALDESGIRQAAASGGFTMPYQKEFFRKDGSRVPVLLVCAFVPGRPNNWMGYAVDLSPARSAPAAPDPAPVAPIQPVPEEFYSRLVSELVNERTRLRAMLDTAGSPIWSTDTAGRLLGFNTAFVQERYRLTGETLQVGDLVLGGNLPVELRRERQGWYDRALAGETVHVLAENMMGTSEIHHQQTLVPMRDTDGTIFGVTVVAHDITERVRQERALQASRTLFRTLADGSPLGIFLADASGQCQYVNERLAAIWRQPADTLLGAGWRERIHPDDAVRLSDDWRTARAEGRDLQTEYRLVMPDGEIRSVRLWINALEEQGRFTGFVGSVEDWTERHALQLRTQQRERLEALGTLAGGIAHDFNNMLSVILAQSQLVMLEPINPAEQRESIEEIRIASLRARELVKQILTFSRQADVDTFAMVDVGALIMETARFVKVMLPSTLAFAVEVPAEPAIVRGNASALQQAIVNLCVNAEHATRYRTQPRLDLALEICADAAVPRVQLAVRDNGTGMSQTVAERIFEPFFTTKGVGDGTGLGLSVVHGTVLAHAGEIAVESTIGEGTTFVISLPLAVVA